jgi:RNA polymerase sigma factor for flagellar operon FliA
MKEQEVKEEEIISYLPLVKRVAARLMGRVPSHIEFDDLVGYGMLGLTEALKTFDSGKKVKFSTYAFYRIKGAMLDGLRAADWLPRPLRHKIRQVESAGEELKASLGRIPSEDELASHLGMEPGEVATLLMDAQQARLVLLEEKIQNSVPIDQENDGLEEEMVKLISDAISTLEEKERLVVSLYYYEEINLKEIGQILGVSESRVSQILSKALTVLKDKMECIKSEL